MDVHTDQTPAEVDAAQQAQYLLYYDDLTGLYNRRFFNQHFTEHTQYAVSQGTPFGLLLIDVDFFKSINDRYGHKSGDAILAGVGGIIRDAVSQVGYPIRYAGDEFVIMLPGLSRADSLAWAEHLVGGVREVPFQLPGMNREVRVTFSIGVSHYPEDTPDISELFEHADHGAYLSKKGGRDQARGYEPGAKHILDASTLHHFFPCPRLVGRERVVDEMLESLAGAARGVVPWAMLCGRGGAGKSRILQEFRNRVDKQRNAVLQGVGLPYRMSQPFGLLLDAIGAHMRDNPQDGAIMAAALSPPEIGAIAKLLPDLSRYAMMLVDSVQLSRDDDRDPYLEAFVKMLKKLGEGRPLCLIFDDFQWTDPGTMKVLELLRERESRAFICLAMRNDEDSMRRNAGLGDFVARVVASGAAEVHGLRGFGAAEVAEMVSAILPDAAVFPHLLQLIHEKSQGVPLVVEEILKYLIHRGFIRYEEDILVVETIPEDEIPTDTGMLLGARAGQTDNEVREIMGRAAVIGSEFDFYTLMALEECNEGFLLGVLERARKAQIVADDWSHDLEHINFVSTQTHDAFYNALPEEERRTLHLRLGEMRQQQYADKLDAALSELAHHFGKGGEAERAEQFRKIISDLYGEYATTEVVVVGKAEDISQFLEEPLPDELLESAAELTRMVKLGVQGIRMYGLDYMKRWTGFKELVSTLGNLLSCTEALTYAEVDGHVLVNGIPLTGNLAFAEGLIELLKASGIKGITFMRGVEPKELNALIEFFSYGRDDLGRGGGLDKLLEKAGATHIRPNYKVYVAIGEQDILLKRNESGREVLIKEVAGEAPPSSGGGGGDMATLYRGASADVVAQMKQEVEELRAALARASSGGGGGGAIDPETLRSLQDARAELAWWKQEAARWVDFELLGGLDRDPEVLIADLESGHAPRIASASRIYVEGGEHSIKPLLEIIRKRKDERTRRIALSLLRKVAPQPLDVVSSALRTAVVEEEIVHLIRAMRDFQDLRVSTPFEPYLRHPSREVREAALEAVASRADGKVEKLLLAILDEDVAPDVLIDVMARLGEQRVSEAVDRLLKIVREGTGRLTREPDERVQCQACITLGQIGDPRAVQALTSLISRGSLLSRPRAPQMRAAAATALARFPDSKDVVLRALAQVAADPEAVVSAAAQASIAELTTERR